jgi:aromatic-L-amino-acid decarboxylase
MHVNHPRFFGFVPGPGNYVSVMAEALAAGYNVFAGTWLGGSAAAAIESVSIDWLRQLCGFPDGCKGLFVSGCAMANLTALAVGRSVILKDRSENAVVYLSDQAHSSLEKALRVLGFFPHQIRRLQSDQQYRLAPEHVIQAVAEDRSAGKRPFCVIATAGTTNTGAADPLPQLRSICDQERMWFISTERTARPRYCVIEAAVSCKVCPAPIRSPSIRIDGYFNRLRPAACWCAKAANA